MGIDLWVAMPPINWLELMALGFDAMDKWAEYSDAQLQKAVKAACDAGFPLQGTRMASCLPWHAACRGRLPLLPRGSPHVLPCALPASCTPTRAAHAPWRAPPFPAGCMENVFVSMHSVAARCYGSAPMKNCAGGIMLAAALDGTVCSAAGVANAPRPLMHIFGQLDGQLRMPRAAWAAAAAAPLAAQFGARWVGPALWPCS